MTAAPVRVPARRPVRPHARPQPPPAVPERRRKKARHGVRGGVVWIFVLGLLLAGVVAVNVAVLRQNMQLENLGRQRTELRDQNLELRSRLSQAVSPSNIQRLARTKLGLVQVAPGETTYIRLGSGGK